MTTIRKAKESDTSQLEKLFLTTRQQIFHWEFPNKFKLEDYKKATEEGWDSSSQRLKMFLRFLFASSI